jgi:ATP-dependent Lon protease
LSDKFRTAQIAASWRDLTCNFDKFLKHEKNLKDLVDLPKTAKSELKIVPVKHMIDVLDIALGKNPVMEPPKVKKQNKEESQEEE